VGVALAGVQGRRAPCEVQGAQAVDATDEGQLPERALVGAPGHGYRCGVNPSCWSTGTPASRPTSSAIRPATALSTGVPGKRIVLPEPAGREPTGRSSNAGPVCVPPPSH